MRRRCFKLGVVVLIVLFTSLCCMAETMDITDMAGRQVKVSVDPDRIVCLGPGALRLIVYLQSEKKVVGVEKMEKMYAEGRPYRIAHPELLKLPDCAPGGPAAINKKPDLESILAVRPQVIFITYMDKSLADQVEALLRIPVVVLSYGNLATFDEAFYDALRIAGEVLNKKDRAEKVVSFIQTQQADLGRRGLLGAKAGKIKVYVGGLGYRGVHGIESTEKRYIPFDWVHADNVADRVESTIGSHVNMDKETLLKFDPDIIFIDCAGLLLVAEDFKKKTQVYQALRAFSDGKVYSLHPFNWYTTNVGTALADAFAIGKIVYKDAFRDIDPEKKADEIYTFLVGKPVYEDMRKMYGKIGGIPNFIGG